MGNTIWKYDIVVEDYFELEMPEGSQVLHVDTLNGRFVGHVFSVSDV